MLPSSLGGSEESRPSRSIQLTQIPATKPSRCYSPCHMGNKDPVYQNKTDPTLVYERTQNAFFPFIPSQTAHYSGHRDTHPIFPEFSSQGITVTVFPQKWELNHSRHRNLPVTSGRTGKRKFCRNVPS